MNSRLFSAFRLIRFALVGGATAGIFVLVVTIADWLGTTSPVITATAYITAIAFQYIAHAKFTFRRRAAAVGQMSRFLVVNAVGLAFSLLVLDVVPANPGSPRGAGSIIA